MTSANYNSGLHSSSDSLQQPHRSLNQRLGFHGDRKLSHRLTILPGSEIQRRLYPLLGMFNTPFTEFPDAVKKQAIAQAWRFGQEKGFKWDIKLAGEWLMSICNDNGKNERRPENKAKRQASIPVKREVSRQLQSLNPQSSFSLSPPPPSPQSLSNPHHQLADSVQSTLDDSGLTFEFNGIPIVLPFDVSNQTFLQHAEDVFHGLDYTVWYTKPPYGQVMISEEADFGRFLKAIHKDSVVRRDGKVVIALLSEAEAFQSPKPEPTEVDTMASDIQTDVTLPQHHQVSHSPSPPVKRKRGRPPKNTTSAATSSSASKFTVPSRSDGRVTRSKTAGNSHIVKSTVDAYKKSTLQASAVRKPSQKRRQATATGRTGLIARSRYKLTTLAHLTSSCYGLDLCYTFVGFYGLCRYGIDAVIYAFLDPYHTFEIAHFAPFWGPYAGIQNGYFAPYTGCHI
ncbi:hypothetical protein FN846DRAFT_896696 [Sphaerosporella brunnea]|uniref:Uncharacterized protein n=1 Tax=Sphaerosporella brunnea TaxID=1250544 RepID=A0A5J5EBL7_9PEZI|nr:hypothetical protein FN846DRAFT_896696 [Sphaerosporella brunnea]